jgi:hypothetical protein
MSFIKTITGISEFGYENNPILSELDEVIIEGKNLFYPSCGNDINDLLYVNSKRMPKVELYIPKVFIHVDFVVDVTAVANLVQPETDKLLGKI